MVTETEGSDSDDEDIVMPLLFYPEDSNKDDYSSKPPSTESTLDPGPPSEKPTNETTSEPYSYALIEPYSPTREGYMGNLPPKGILRYQKGSDLPRLATIEEHTKEGFCGDKWKYGFWSNMRVWSQYKTS